MEWTRMSDSFLISFYDQYNSDNYQKWSKNIRYPWNVIVNNINEKIRPITYELRSLITSFESKNWNLCQGFTQIKDYLSGSGHYILTFSQTKARIIHDEKSNLSLIYLIDPTDKQISKIYVTRSLYNSLLPRYVIDNDILYDSTRDCPIIRFDDGLILISE
jgi:hypothetical protein